MKDNRFIELVNLYIDRQISAEETAELEAEIQANPRRRAIYRQYCQLHTATKQVYAGFRAEATGTQAAAAPGRVVRAEFSRRSRSNWIHYAGGLAAAACFAVMLVRYNANSQPVQGIIAESSPAPAAMVADAGPARSEVSAIAAEPVASVAPKLEHPLLAEPNYAEMVRALRQEDQRLFAAGQIQTAPLPSLFDDGVFEARPVFLPANSPRVFRGKQAPDSKAAFTAFEFQR